MRVLCFGSLLAGDDGFGIHLLGRLRAAPPVRAGLTIELVDAGLMGLGALSYFEDCEHAIVVDALGALGEVGRVHRLLLSDLAAPAAAFNAHALDLTHLFHVLPILFEGRSPPRITIVGAEIDPPHGPFCMQLSPPLTAALEPARQLIESELDALAAAARSLPRSQAC